MTRTASLGLLLGLTGCVADAVDDRLERGRTSGDPGTADAAVDPCGEAGVCVDAAADEVPDRGQPAGARYPTLLVFDDDSPDDGGGTAGVDICGVTADCATAISATLVLGDGEVCLEEGPGCATSRTDVTAILDDGRACEAGSVPSDYVSLGMNGSISVDFDGSLAGCTVTIVEFAGATQEAWSAYVCTSAVLEDAICLNDDLPVFEAPAGGRATFDVPAE